LVGGNVFGVCPVASSIVLYAISFASGRSLGFLVGFFLATLFILREGTREPFQCR
jgi:hypothetical protein